MPETTAAPARVCLLDDGYSREARSLLYNCLLYTSDAADE